VEEFNSFLNKYHVRRIPRGEIILVQGEVPTSAFVVKKGVVKAYNLTSQGEEKPISFDMIGEILPIGWIFKKTKFAQYYYEAFIDTELYCVPRSDYHQFILSNPKTLYDIHTRLVNYHLNFQMRINALEQSKATAKVINTIHFLALNFGKEIKKEIVRIQLPFTQQDLANYMGLTRETTGIELKKLQRKGVLTYRRQYYMVHTDKLGELLDDDYDLGMVS
jgi:CRP/FNR family transcriptional regulator